MPQMAPLNWLTLFLFFSFLYLIFNIINYFSFHYPTSSGSKSKPKIIINWKW